MLLKDLENLAEIIGLDASARLSRLFFGEKATGGLNYARIVLAYLKSPESKKFDQNEDGSCPKD